MERLRYILSCMKSVTYSVCKTVDLKYQEQFGFKLNETTCEKILDYLYAPKDSSSLAVTRILFGLSMMFDIPDERGGSIIDKRWGDPNICHFPLIPFITAIPMPYMAVIYAMLWIGALGIALGYKYHVSASLFTLCYWYLFLIEKSFWNNHSYLFGVVSLLLTFTQANSHWSVDAYLNPTILKTTVPYWNYFILKYQFFILYFMAGMKKGTAEWLTGYSVQNLSEHWVFTPFKLFLSVPQTDYFIVHWFVFSFDLTVAVWMMWAPSRNIAMLFCSLFHLMNSRLFRIGMFPWVCLATMPLFYPFDWPRTIIGYLDNIKSKLLKLSCMVLYKNVDFKLTLKDNDDSKTKTNQEQPETEDVSVLNDGDSPSKEMLTTNDGFNEGTDEKIEENKTSVNKHDGRYLTLIFVMFHVVSQAILPYSHFITKGYNNWTKGLYGYSWDMMVHTWDLETVVIKVVDNTNNREFYIDPYINSPNDRWTRHGDMVHQYARCLNEKLSARSRQGGGHSELNISIFMDIWCSLNGRFTQRMFDPKVDLLKVSWSPFKPVSFLMPLLDEALDWRGTLQDIKTDVHSWNNYSDVIFSADFPGYDQEKYIPSDLSNITLTILNGSVAYEPEVTSGGHSYKLSRGDHIHLNPDTFHRVINIGDTPAYYMYTFANTSEILNIVPPKPKLPVYQELHRRINNMIKFFKLVISKLFEVFLNMERYLL
ncbi:vitamin K-dependent gamma-carboxylase [Danaus plexippus]|uniref:vitamin K-dependent gamma-carboxylase n=1 Tax=Danaus plexippus TaxID=13037 RepID=UPI002AAFD446|nr:vitamin K-dependent gamma-carboxylase [Danaus plexippus]